MGKVEDLTPKDLHCVIAQYEVLASNEEKACEEVKKIFEINKEIKTINIHISLRKD